LLFLVKISGTLCTRNSYILKKFLNLMMFRVSSAETNAWISTYCCGSQINYLVTHQIKFQPIFLAITVKYCLHFQFDVMHFYQIALYEYNVQVGRPRNMVPKICSQFYQHFIFLLTKFYRQISRIHCAFIFFKPRNSKMLKKFKSCTLRKSGTTTKNPQT